MKGVEAKALAALVAPLAVFAVALGAHATRYLTFFSDDALISLRYVKRFVAGDGLTWTDGEYVEGYSNLAWVVLVSIPTAVGVDPIVAARITGVLCFAVMAASLTWSYRDRPDCAGVVASTAALLFVALSGPAAVWVMGGLEQPLIAALLALAIPPVFRVLECGDRRAALLASIPLGLLCVTRPDGPIFAIIVVGVLLLMRRRAVALALRVAALPVALIGSQLAFRVAYYGELVPNTAHVKLALSWDRALGGVEFVGEGLWSIGPFVLAAAAALLFAPRRRAAVLVALGAGWCAYLAFIGGDYNGRRHFVPVITILAFALAEGIASVWSTSVPAADRRRRRTLATALAGVAAVVLGGLQAIDPHNRDAAAEIWPRLGMKLGLFLKDAFGSERPLLAVTAAGCLPYASELPSLDMLGLNDRHIAKTIPLEGTRATIGHELGDGAYVLSRRPDLIVYHHGRAEPTFKSGWEMAATPEYWDEYVKVIFVTPPPDPFGGYVWVRRWSEKVGVRQTEAGLRIPGYLLEGVTPAFMKAGRVLVLLQPGATARFDVPPARGHVAHVEVVPRLPSVAALELSASGSRVAIANGEAHAIAIEAVEVALEPAISEAPARSASATAPASSSAPAS